MHATTPKPPIFAGFEFDLKSTCACVPKDESKGSEAEGERVERSQGVNQALQSPKNVGFGNDFFSWSRSQ